MPKMNLSHFEATFLLAFLISIIMGITTKRTDRERLKYGLRCFVYFLVVVFGLGWVMHFGHG